MSKNPNTPSPNVVPGETVEAKDKPSLIQRTKTFVKNHKKSTITAGVLVGLVGASAWLGRQSAPYDLAVVENDDLVEDSEDVNP